jgi:aryl-alcohol dehydrogenase-like predicted oxidoreductase
MTVPPLIGRRPIPGTSATASVLGIAVGARTTASPVVDGGMVATALRRARERGVTTFDLAHGGSLPRAQRWVAAAFPQRDPELLFIVGRSWPRMEELRRGIPGRTADSTGLVQELEVGLAEEARRLDRHGPVLVDFDAGEAPAEAFQDATAVLERHRKEGLIAGWSLHRPAALEAHVDFPDTPSAFCVELSLLHRSALSRLAERASRGTLGALVRNPFAEGRLDGTRFAATLTERGPPSAPLDVRSLHAEFDPILGLGFLTEGRRRTLAQAAVQFLTLRPWVSTVLVPLPRPERWEEILGAASAPPLDPAEMARLGEPSTDEEGRGFP